MKENHRCRTIRNLAAAALLYLLYWYCIGAPLPTMEMELHRNERQHLLPASRVIWDYDTKRNTDRRIIVGLGPNHISLHTESHSTTFWPRSADEPTLFLLPEDLRYNPAGTVYTYRTPALAAVDAPARTRSARLTIEVDYNDWSETYIIQGQDKGSLWLFQLEYKYLQPVAAESGSLSEAESELLLQQHDMEEHAFWSLTLPALPESLERVPYILEFFDTEGKLIETVANS